MKKLHHVRKLGGPRLRATRTRMLNMVSARPTIEIRRRGHPSTTVAAYTPARTKVRLLIVRVIECSTAKPRIANTMTRLAAQAPDRMPTISGRKEAPIATARKPEVAGG